MSAAAGPVARGTLWPSDTTHAAAIAENHLRDAVAVVREQYGTEEHLARQWVLVALMEVFGVPERAAYPTIDYLERVSHE